MLLFRLPLSLSLSLSLFPFYHHFKNRFIGMDSTRSSFTFPFQTFVSRRVPSWPAGTTESPCPRQPRKFCGLLTFFKTKVNKTASRIYANRRDTKHTDVGSLSDICLRRTCVLLLADQIQISLFMFVNLDAVITKKGKFSGPPSDRRSEMAVKRNRKGPQIGRSGRPLNACAL